jgi:glycosyltransferase involved in cell wall biosynthesis
MQTFRPDIVHLHAPLGKLDFLYFRYLRSLGARIFYTAHDAVPLIGESRWSDWARYQGADGIFVHSSRCQRYLLDGGIDEGKITRIPHANYLDLCDDMDLSKEKARELLGVPIGSRVVLFFGAIAPYKGLDVLIDAFARLQKDDPHVYLVIAGGPLEDFGSYGRRIEALGASNRILRDLRYIPFAEFSKFFLATDVVALPYRRISQSGVLQLAYGFGRPVVVTDVGGLGEAVAEDGTGIVISEPDSGELALAIRQLLADPEAAVRMGTQGRILAGTKYSWQSVARGVVDAYDGAGHGGRRIARGRGSQ